MNRYPEAGLTSLLASRGRGGDTMLVHMNPEEVRGLQALAVANGTGLSYNPDTGLPEALKLKDILPQIAGAVLTGGLGFSPLTAAATVGAGYGLVEGDLKKGLMAGLGAYSGANIAGGLKAAAGVDTSAPPGQVVQEAAGATPSLAGSSQAMRAAAGVDTSRIPTMDSMREAAAKGLSPTTAIGASAAQAGTTTKMPFLSTMSRGISNVFTSDQARNKFMEGLGGNISKYATFAGAMLPFAEKPVQFPTGGAGGDELVYIPGQYDPSQGTVFQSQGQYYRRTPQGLVPVNPFQMAPSSRSGTFYGAAGGIIPRPNISYPGARDFSNGYEAKIGTYTGEETFAIGGEVDGEEPAFRENRLDRFEPQYTIPGTDTNPFLPRGTGINPFAVEQPGTGGMGTPPLFPPSPSPPPAVTGGTETIQPGPDGSVVTSPPPVTTGPPPTAQPPATTAPPPTAQPPAAAAPAPAPDTFVPGSTFLNRGLAMPPGSRASGQEQYDYALGQYEKEQFSQAQSIMAMNPNMSFDQAMAFVKSRPSGAPPDPTAFGVTGSKATATTVDPSANWNWGSNLKIDPNVRMGDFDWQKYILANPDLEKAGIDTPWEAMAHYSTYGKTENRPGVSFGGFATPEERKAAFEGQMVDGRLGVRNPFADETVPTPAPTGGAPTPPPPTGAAPAPAPAPAPTQPPTGGGRAPAPDIAVEPRPPRPMPTPAPAPDIFAPRRGIDFDNPYAPTTTPAQREANVAATRSYIEELNKRAKAGLGTKKDTTSTGGLGAFGPQYLPPPSPGGVAGTGEDTTGGGAGSVAAFLATQAGINWMMQPGNAKAMKDWIEGGMKWSERPFFKAEEKAPSDTKPQDQKPADQQGQQDQPDQQQPQSKPASTGTSAADAASVAGAASGAFNIGSAIIGSGGRIIIEKPIYDAANNVIGYLTPNGPAAVTAAQAAELTKAGTSAVANLPADQVAKAASQAGGIGSVIRDKIIPGVGTAIGAYSTAKAIEAGKEGQAALSAAGTAASAAKLLNIGALGGPVGMAAAAALAAIGASMVNTKEFGDVALRNYWNAVDSGRGIGQTEPVELAQGFINFYRTNKNNFAGQEKYGRTGNEDFVYDMTQVINKAVKDGKVDKNVDAAAMYQKVVQPWLNSMGSGPQNEDAKRIQDFMMTDLINSYMQGKPISNAQVKNDKKFKIVSEKPVYAGTPPQPKAEGKRAGGFLSAPNPYAMGGAIGEDFNFGFAQGGYPGEYKAGGKLLDGPGDGMSDDIPAVIRGRGVQRAALADGEFVIPADVVSHLGNGSTKAGAKKLYQMMDKIRTARTGKTRQAPAVKADKYLPV